MTIEDFLKNNTNQARLSAWNNWLYWDTYDEQWVVLTRGYKRRHNTCLYRGQDLDKALECLLTVPCD